MSTSTNLPIAVEPVALVTTECITVTSAMRKHARWAHSSVSAILGGSGVSRVYDRDIPAPPSPRSGAATPRARSSRSTAVLDEDHALANRWGLRGKKGKSMQDNPLISAFTRLRSDLKGCKDIRTFDTPALLHPFCRLSVPHPHRPRSPRLPWLQSLSSSPTILLAGTLPGCPWPCSFCPLLLPTVDSRLPTPLPTRLCYYGS